MSKTITTTAAVLALALTASVSFAAAPAHENVTCEGEVLTTMPDGSATRMLVQLTTNGGMKAAAAHLTGMPGTRSVSNVKCSAEKSVSANKADAVEMAENYAGVRASAK